MLERGSLLIRDAGADGSRPIEDMATGARLGTAKPAESWTRWLPLHPALEVREEGDSPLVFTVHRRWLPFPRQQVRDAEGRTVGSLVGARVGGHGFRRAVLGRDGAFRRDDGTVAARITREKGGIALSFDAERATDPFERMLLLAAALSA